MIYVPEFDNNSCVVKTGQGVLRVYDSTPTQNSTINYTDYYIRDDYQYQNGTTTFGQWATIPVCISHDQLTTNWYYRVDLPSILLIFAIFSLFSIYIPLRVFSRIWRRL